jgi:hypothetical protein
MNGQDLWTAPFLSPKETHNPANRRVSAPSQQMAAIHLQQLLLIKGRQRNKPSLITLAAAVLQSFVRYAVLVEHGEEHTPLTLDARHGAAAQCTRRAAIPSNHRVARLTQQGHATASVRWHRVIVVVSREVHRRAQPLISAQSKSPTPPPTLQLSHLFISVLLAPIFSNATRHLPVGHQ